MISSLGFKFLNQPFSSHHEALLRQSYGNFFVFLIKWVIIIDYKKVGI